MSQHVHRPGIPAAAGSEAQLNQQVQVAERERQGGDRTENAVTTQPEEGYTLLTARGTCTPGTSNSSSVTKTRFVYAIESLPFIETVSPKLRKAIIEGKDVNLAQLLIPTNNAVNMSEKEHSCDKEDKYDKDPQLHKTLSIAEFIYAFGIYKNIMCQTYPNRREELDLYERDIVDMATRYGGKGFYEYHKTFSARAAAHLRYSNIPVDWSVRDNTLFCNIFANIKPSACFNCNSISHVAAFCPLASSGRKDTGTNQRKNTDIQGRPRIMYNDKEICNNFNSARGCNNSRCGNAHVCLNCRGEHTSLKCISSESKNDQAPRSKK